MRDVIPRQTEQVIDVLVELVFRVPQLRVMEQTVETLMSLFQQKQIDGDDKKTYCLTSVDRTEGEVNSLAIDIKSHESMSAAQHRSNRSTQQRKQWQHAGQTEEEEKEHEEGEETKKVSEREGREGEEKG